MTTNSLEQRALELFSHALDQPSDTRMDYVRREADGDADLIARVAGLLNADSDGGSALRTGGAGHDTSDVPLPERIGAYKVTGLIGQGGMGAVYKGERDAGDFDHIAAIKVIRPGILSDSLSDRFGRERQTLAGLNHPGIARLYDGGQMPDGSPFMVMEYVDGEPILEWGDAEGRSHAERLSLFADLAAAVRHAHQNLIIHRDITPSNVLVTANGHAKLIDFGIAKPQADEDLASGGANSLASLSFTPGYAAPERSKGAAANTLSDVFSLGKILEALLGEHANEDEKAIIARACAFEQSERYPSVDALMDDLEHLQTGYPVEARGGGTTYRFGKFLTRRKFAVSFGSLAVAGLVGALGVTLVQYNRAETALVRAEARFDQARALSNTLIFDVYDEFAKVSGTLEPRKQLAGIVRDYVEELAKDPEAPDDILYEVGTTKLRLSDLYGGIGIAHLGETELSYDLLLEAETVLTSLMARDPGNMAALAELVMVKRMLANQSQDYKLDMEAAQVYNREVLDMAERGAAVDSDSQRTLLRHFWSGRTDRLRILKEQEAYDEALEALAIWRPELTDEMFERLGGGEEMAAYLAVQEAEILRKTGRGEAAIAPLDYAISYRSKMLEDTPENYYQLTQLMVALDEKANVLSEAGASGEARDLAERAVVIARQIMAIDPEDAGGPEGLASMLNTLARIEFQGRAITPAVTAIEEAEILSRGLVAKSPDTDFYARILVDTLALKAELYLSQNRQASACAALQESAELLGAMTSADANEMDIFAELASDIEAQRGYADCPA